MAERGEGVPAPKPAMTTTTKSTTIRPTSTRQATTTAFTYKLVKFK